MSMLQRAGRSRRARVALVVGLTAALAIVLVVLAGVGLAAPESSATPATAQYAPTNTSLPSISGTAQVGQVLSGNDGSWSNASTITRRWQRCDSNGNNCVTLAADGFTYRMITADVGHKMRLQVTATNSDGSTVAVSGASDVVKSAVADLVNKSLPTITGTPQDNQTLTAQAGVWTGTAPITFRYQWLRCDSNGNNCVAISGATSPMYRVTSKDVGHRLRIQVTAQNSTGSKAVISGPTGVATAAGSTPAPTPSGGGTIQASAVALPNRLVVDKVQFNPSRIASRSQPLIGRYHVVDANGRPVQGALVYTVGIPFSRLSGEPETPTAPDGWATITYRVLPAFPIKKGYLLTIFVRARKPGGSVLGGVSTKRLVSVRAAG